MNRLKRSIRKLALLEHKLEEKTIQLANQEQHEEGKIKRASELFHSVGSVTRWRARTKAKVWAKELHQPKIPPLDRFRNYAKLALICIRLCKYSHENLVKSQDEYLSIIQITEDFVPIIEQDEMFFDARIYRASKEQRLPVEARKILKRDPRYRTDKEVNYVSVNNLAPSL